MKSFNERIAATYLAAILTVICFFYSAAQSPLYLSIGDKAPELKYSKWLKGTPIKSMEANRLYVVEFWATWCGSCIAAMPHLSDLAEKYKDQAAFIGVNVWENTQGKLYESALPAVVKFVNANSRRMRYHVIVDNNAQDMVNLWLKPAKVIGIPMTFIVKNGLIAWIGHPTKLDKVLDPIIADTFDIAGFKKSYEENLIAYLESETRTKQELESIKQATDAKDFKKAFQLMDEGLTRNPKMVYLYKITKFKIMLDNFPEADVLQFAKEWSAERNDLLSYIAGEILKKEGLSRTAYLYSAESFAKAIEKDPLSSSYHSMAQAYEKAGDFKSAAQAEQKAVSKARAERKDPNFQGKILDSTIDDYEKALDKYKKLLR